MSINYQAAVNISAQYTGEQAIAKARRDIDSLDKNVAGMSGGLGKAVGLLKAFVAAAAVKETVEFAKSIIDMAANLGELSKKTGFSIQSLSDLKAAAEDNGVQFEQLEGGLRKFSLASAKTAAGNRELLGALQAIGISASDAKVSASELLLKVSDAFAKFKDGPGKAAVAVALFGKSGTDMIPVLDQGRHAIEGMGIQLSDKFSKQAHEFDVNLNRLKRSSKEFGISILQDLVPALNELLEKWLVLRKDMANGFPDAQKRIESTPGGLAGIGERLSNNKLDIATVALRDGVNAFRTLFSYVGLGSAPKSSYPVPGPWSGAYGRGPGSTGKPADAEGDSRPDINFAGKEHEAQRLREIDTIKKYQIESEKQLNIDREAILVIDKESDAYQKKQIAVKETANAEHATVGFLAEQKRAYMDATDEIIRQKQELIDLENRQKDSFGRGAQQSIAEYANVAKNNAAQMKSVFTDAFKGIEDALVLFVQTGKLSFADMARAIEADLIRIAVKKALVFGISSVTSLVTGGIGGGGGDGLDSALTGGRQDFALGGIMTSRGAVALRKYAGGGVATSPQLALYGEGSRPEAFVPLPDGRNIPVKMQGSGGGTSVVVNVSVASDGSSDEKTAAGSDSKMRQLGGMIAAAVKQEIITQKRPGGLLTT